MQKSITKIPALHYGASKKQISNIAFLMAAAGYSVEHICNHLSINRSYLQYIFPKTATVYSNSGVQTTTFSSQTQPLSF